MPGTGKDPLNTTATQTDVGVRAPWIFDATEAWPYEMPMAAALMRAAHLPEWRVETVPHRCDARTILPADAAVVLAYREGRTCRLTAEGPGYVVYISVRRSESEVNVAADTAEHADQVLAEITGAIDRPDPGTVGFTLWRWDKGKAESWRRDLRVPTWAEIARNYSDQAALGSLMSLTSVAGTGRLMLWTGPPGTGKTNAIRALARSWSPWCDAHLVIDPEQFFGDAAYLIAVMAKEDEYHDDSAETEHPKARLIICEDADDFIRARHRAGSGVGRLLNVADGLLGQGLNNIVLLTSNTAVDRVDPALVRPGRLLANLEFGRFSPSAARTWLGDPYTAVPSDGLTLAELYERVGAVSRQVSERQTEPSTGAYL